MPFDGLFLHKVLDEIRALIGGRVDKLSQPSSDTLVIAIRAVGATKKLLISTEGSNARIQLTAFSAENPASPPMFTMLLRKHLMNAKLVDVVQYGADRTAELVFLSTNELGDEVNISLVCELMGRRSNIILVDAKRHIIDAMHRIDPATNPERPILSRLEYISPPRQDKLNILSEGSAESFTEAVIAHGGVLSKAIINTLEGFSPMLSMELAVLTGGGENIAVGDIDTAKKERLKNSLASLIKSIRGQCSYTAIYSADEKLIDFSFVDIFQYGTDCIKRYFNTAQELLDEIYKNTGQASSLRQRAETLSKSIKTIRERLQRKLARQADELESSLDRDEKKKLADLLSANLYRVREGADSVEVEDFYTENQPTIKIPLNTRLTPAQNAQRYYSEYKKLVMAEKMLTRLIAEGENELKYLDEVSDALNRAESTADITAIRDELIQEGILKSSGTGKKQQKPQKISPKQYLSTDGYTILCGRNNTQNDRLTTKLATNYDMWCHTQGSPGSHTILVSKGVGDSFPNRAIEEACIIAACNSQSSQSGKVAVDYTTVKFVKKPRGARPGMVIYTDYSTAYITPDFELEKKLRIK